MKILMFVSNAFTNDPRVYNEAQSLLNAGHEVTVIAWDRDQQNIPEEIWDGIHVIRLQTIVHTKHTKFNWLWVGLGLLLWQQKAFRYALSLLKKDAFDAIHCHDFDTLFIGTRLKNKHKIPLIYDAHEIYAYMLARTFPQWVVKLLIFMEKMAVKKVDRIINVCEPQRDYFRGITDKPITLIMNCKPLEAKEYQKPSKNDNLTILYIGGLHPGRPIPMLIQSVKDLQNVRCIIGGVGHPSYVNRIKEQCAETANVTFLGKVPFNEVLPLTKEADCIFFMLNPNDPNNAIGLGNKIFEAMVCGKPIICTRGIHSGEFIERERMGLSVAYSQDALIEAIVSLRDDKKLPEKLGRNALKAAIREYNWQKQEEKLLTLYNTLIKT